MVDLESDLRFDEHTLSGSLNGFYRFGREPKHALHFSLGVLDREATGFIEDTLPIFDLAFEGGYHSEFRYRQLGLSYQFSFVNTGRVETGFLAGLALTELQFTIEAAARLEGVLLGSIQKKTSSVIAPVPMVGFFTNYAIRPNLVMRYHVSFLNFAVGANEGSALNGGVEFTWFFSRHLGIGLGIGGAELNYEKDEPGDRLKVDFRQSSFTAILFSYVH